MPDAIPYYDQDGSLIETDTCMLCKNKVGKENLRNYFKVDFDLDGLDLCLFNEHLLSRYGWVFCKNSCFLVIDRLMSRFGSG